MKKAAVFFGTGYEEIEALTVVDLLRRVGIETVCVAVDNKSHVTGSHNISVAMDTGIDALDFNCFDILVCPGGMPGTKNLEACTELTEQLRKFSENGKLIAAICAAPSIFGHMGLLAGKKACIYPGMEKELSGAEVCFDAVVKSGNIIMSRGMGTAIAFSLEIIASLLDKETADDLAKKIVYTK
ncbi:MAG: DJ-1/PfpI family protein [Lachnospiraceae bacterium]|jgi:4-methyl-5(b-hydroxyethyl)-thiazole monophosphate biosynthesis|nr:DJ-1/PfpI family protein [Lachnospiraceae bacterium]